MELSAELLVDLDQRFSALDSLDYFQVLKLEPNATPAEIKKAFYSESRAFHPDRFFKMGDSIIKDRVNVLYKRITEAYHVLRDDTRRRTYVADLAGPDRAARLRFSESSETESKHAARREAQESIGTHPKGRQFFQTAMVDAEAERFAGAERNLKMALTYEPQNALYKEKLLEVQAKLKEQSSSR